jgi:hypothetical protein
MNPSTSPTARSHDLSAADKAAQEEAHELLVAAGSDQAQRAVESAVGQELAPKRDAFARDLSFRSYLELFEASKPLTTNDEKHWLATNLGGDQWIVWNEQELAIVYRVESLDEAQRVAQGAMARERGESPPTG